MTPTAHDVIGKQVVDILLLNGFTADWAYPGHVSVDTDNPEQWWAFGVANGRTWGGDLVTFEGDVLRSCDLGVSADCEDVDAIVSAIRNTVRQ